MAVVLARAFCQFSGFYSLAFRMSHFLYFICFLNFVCGLSFFLSVWKRSVVLALDDYVAIGPFQDPSRMVVSVHRVHN